LRDAHYPGAARLGHGTDYQYSHDAEFGVAAQQYLPDELLGTRYYEPTGYGNERDVAARLEKIRALLNGRGPRGE
jgi:putative ATPase